MEERRDKRYTQSERDYSIEDKDKKSYSNREDIREKRPYPENNYSSNDAPSSKFQKKDNGPKKSDKEQAIDLQKEQDHVARKEDEFHITQTKIRASKRIKEKRGKPIDFLFSVTRFPQDIPDSVTFPSPSKVINALSKPEIEELMVDLPSFKKIDFDFKDYWISVEALVAAQLRILSNKKEDDPGMHSAILPDVRELLEGKSTEELLQVELFIKLSTDLIDDEYWHSVIKKLHFFRAQARADELYKQVVKARLAELLSTGLPQVSVNEIEKKFFAAIPKKEFVPEKPVAETKKEEVSGRRPTPRTGRFTNDVEMQKIEEEKGETEDEVRFTREVEVDESQVGRKPLYYNRERMGINWTKHNQVMYDDDNPPPVSTLGYEFNIYYPDMLDKTKTPRYELLTTENPDLLIIVFKAGPPYKDLGFKISALEWEYSQKKGYRCEFSNGIFHLHCWCKRFRYRR
jgi:hypothetical protein